MAAAAAWPLAEDDWAGLTNVTCPLVIIERDIAALAPAVSAVLGAGHSHRAEGTPRELALALAALPTALRADIVALATRFCSQLAIARCRLRLERIERQPCWKWHADFVRVRLITNYAGAGTEYLPHGMEDESAARSLAPGAIGLFKGRMFDADHRPCIHRSPPFAAGDPPRLLLVIDEAEAAPGSH